MKGAINIDLIFLNTNGEQIDFITQWDYGQTLIISGDNLIADDITHVHFSNKHSDRAYVVPAQIIKNNIVADIPDLLLSEPYPINVYLVVKNNYSGRTKYSGIIPIHRRIKPDNVIYPGDVEVVDIAKLQSDVAELTAMIETLQDSLSQKLQKKAVQALPSASVIYSFDDGQTVFSVPRGYSSNKGTSTIDYDSENDNYYQHISLGAASGSTENVVSKFIFPESLTNDVKTLTIDFDFLYENTGGRLRMAFCDMDVINAKANSNIRNTYDGIAFDVVSPRTGAYIQINGGAAGYSEAFFAQWLNIRLTFDLLEKKVQYSIKTKTNSTSIMSGTVDFHDTEITKVTGIALYSWVAENVYFDNIAITAEYVIRENVIYLIPTGEGYIPYIYVDEKPHRIIAE